MLVLKCFANNLGLDKISCTENWVCLCVQHHLCPITIFHETNELVKNINYYDRSNTGRSRKMKCSFLTDTLYISSLHCCITKEIHKSLHKSADVDLQKELVNTWGVLTSLYHVWSGKKKTKTTVRALRKTFKECGVIQPAAGRHLCCACVSFIANCCSPRIWPWQHLLKNNAFFEKHADSSSTCGLCTVKKWKLHLQTHSSWL